MRSSCMVLGWFLLAFTGACAEDASGDAETGSTTGTSGDDGSGPTTGSETGGDTAAADSDGSSGSDGDTTGGTTTAAESTGGDSTGAAESTGSMVDACAEISTTLFASVELQECGLGPGGTPEMCNWTIRFDNMMAYHWEYSDVTEDGTVACEGETIVGTPMAGGGPRMGTFDVATMTLTWEGVDYQ